MPRLASIRDFDWILLVFVLIICALGVVEIRSATVGTKFAGAHIKQIYWILGGLAAMYVMSNISYHALLDRIPLMYGISLAALLAVLMFGNVALGAKRWIRLPGGIHFQPSEWVKLILILAMAKYFSDNRSAELSWPDFLKAGALVGLPMLLVLREPDLELVNQWQR